MRSEALQILSSNIVFNSKLMTCFLYGYEKDVPIMLIYTLLPVVLFENSREKLIKISSRSTIDTITRQTEFLATIQYRYDKLKAETNKALIFGHNHDKFILASTIKNNTEYEELESFLENEELGQFYIAAKNYGHICKRAESVVEIYKKLRIIV